MIEINPVALRKLLAEHFSISEINTLCFDLGVDKEYVAGETDRGELSVKVMAYFQRQDRLAELLDAIERARPGLYSKYLSVELDLERARVKREEEDRRRRERKFERVVNQPPLHVRDTFKDRVKQMAELCEHLTDSGVRLISVVGRGGIGKTALVSKVFADLEHGTWCIPASPGPFSSTGEGEQAPTPGPSHASRERGEEPFIIYLGAKTTGLTLERLYADVGRVLDQDAAKELDEFYRQPGKLEDKARFLLSRLQNGLYFIVMDNLESVLRPDGVIADEGLCAFVETCLVTEHGVRLVVTGREDVSVSPAGLARVRRVPLREGLPDDDAVSLLRQFDPDGEGGLRDAPDASLREAARKVHGVPYALERIAGILRSTPDLSLERFLGDHELFSGQVVENLAEYSYTHLSESARRVMEALAVFDRPTPETAVRYLLLPFAPDVDVTGELRRLWREMLVISNRTTGTFALHPLDREAAYRRLEQAPSFPTLLPEGGGRFPSPFGRGARGEGQPYDSHTLELRAAEYYKETRKPREQWKTIDDLEPQLAEFEHRVRAADYDGAGWLLDEIDFDYLQLWGHALRVIGMREKLTGHLTGQTLEQKNWGFIGLCYWAIGQARRAIECYERALEQAQADHDRQGECAWLGNLGNAYLTLGETHRTLQLLEQALTIAREIGARQVEGVSLGSLGLVHSNQGEPQQAIEFYRQALAIARDIGDRRVEDAWLGHLGNAYFALGKLRHAIEAYEQALIIAREIGNRRDENALRGCLGRAYVALGEPQEAIEFFDQALMMARSIGDRYVEGDLLGSMGSAYFAMDIADQAIELYQSALAAARDIGDRSGQSRWLLGLSMAYQTTGDLSQARTCAEQSLALDMPDTVGGAALRLGILAVQSGNRAGAAQYFGLAISKCRDLLDKTPELYGVLYADGTALAGQAAISRRSPSGDGQSSAVALEIYQRAIDIFAGPTILKNTLRDLRYLQSAGCEGLELVIQLLETRAA